MLSVIFSIHSEYCIQFLVANTRFCYQVGDACVPIAFAVLEDKSTASYELALATIKAAVPGWSPEGVVSDFEKAELKAIRNVFPNVKWIQGCHFHFCQCLLRNFKKVPDYNDDVELYQTLQLLKALPFLPSSLIRSTWTSIERKLLSSWPQTKKFCLYFESTWVDNSVYDLELWNCYNQTLERLPRTNNVSEGQNNGMRVLFGASNPTIWKCISNLRLIQTKTDTILLQQSAGRYVASRVRKERLRREEKLYSYVLNFNPTCDIEVYLRRLSFLTVSG